ncbi:MAG: nucleoside phosphorylase [Thermomicrobiales bacterium]
MTRDLDDPLASLPERCDQAEPSVFLPANLLREARRQRGLANGDVPPVCLLDPDGDIVRHLVQTGGATRSLVWACYHTDLYETEFDGIRFGVVGCAVGAPFAVLVAEQLFVSGCTFLISVTSAGQIAPQLELPCVILIDRALRGEGTSQCYLPRTDYAEADPSLVRAAEAGLQAGSIAYRRGATWTTDAPFRETASAIAVAADAGALAVEMEAAALYAFACASGNPVLCFAMVTNQMAKADGDFEKGPTDGADESLRVVAAAVRGVQGAVIANSAEGSG